MYNTEYVYTLNINAMIDLQQMFNNYCHTNSKNDDQSSS